MESKNFKKHELSCSCCGEEGVDPQSLMMLQELRDLWGKPLVLSSAYRCKNHKEEKKKVKAGTHNRGIAFDIKTTPAEQVQLIPLAISLGFKGFGLGKTFLHIDAREQDYISAWHY